MAMRRNARLGVINGVLFTLGDALSSASFVLALLVRQLGGSLLLVGLLPALQSGGYLLPQMLVSGRLQAMPAKLGLYRRAALARLAAFTALVAATFAAAVVPPRLSLWLIIIAFTIFCIGGGTSTLAFQEVVAKVVPARRRGGFFGMRQLGGGLLTVLVAGPLARWLLADPPPAPFPANYGLLVTGSLLCYAGGIAAFSRIEEPPEGRAGPRLRLADSLRRAPRLLRDDDNYRWFIVSRVLSRCGQIAEPFYIIYAIETLGLPASLAGVYLAVRALSGALSNIAWGRVSDRRGNRALLLISGGLLALTPLLALAAPPVAAGLGLGAAGASVAVGLVFLASGAANDASNIAGMTYLLEAMPEPDRPIAIAFANTIFGIVTFLPVIGGWLIAVAGYRGAFAVALACSLLGLAASFRLAEPRRATR